MFHDPIVDEVRAVRERLAAQFNFDIRMIIEDAQRRQATTKSRIVSFERPTQGAADRPGRLTASLRARENLPGTH